MGISFTELIKLIEIISPPFLMEEWDNSGIQIKTSNKDIEKIMVALEVRDDIVQEAIFNKVDMIITHHPLIFHEINQINIDDPVGRYIENLVRNGISVYSIHTTFDKAIGGNNDYLIGLIDLKMSRLIGTGNFGEFGIGRLVTLEAPISLDSLISAIKDGLVIPAIEIKKVGDAGRAIQKIGICSGSGASLIPDALKNGCDCMITGDIKYHDAQYAKEMGLCLIDAGHYHTEKIFSKNFAERLNKLAGNKINIIESKININPFGNF